MLNIYVLFSTHSHWPSCFDSSLFYANKIFNPDSFKFVPLCQRSEIRDGSVLKTKWRELRLAWDLSALALIHHAWHYLQSHNYWDGELEAGGSEMHSPEVQRRLSTQIPLQALLWCTVIGSTSRASRLFAVPRLDFYSFVLCASDLTLQQFTVQDFHCATVSWTSHRDTFSVKQSGNSFAVKHPHYTRITKTHLWFNEKI